LRLRGLRCKHHVAGWFWLRRFHLDGVGFDLGEISKVVGEVEALLDCFAQSTAEQVVPRIRLLLLLGRHQLAQALEANRVRCHWLVGSLLRRLHLLHNFEVAASDAPKLLHRLLHLNPG